MTLALQLVADPVTGLYLQKVRQDLVWRGDQITFVELRTVSNSPTDVLFVEILGVQ